MIRSDGQRPDDALVIMMLLYYSLHRSCDTYAVASHPVRMIYAVLVLECCTHTLGVLESQLEDLANFDTASELYRLSAVRATVAFLKCLDIRNDISGVVSAIADTCKVVVLFVSACAHVDCAYELCIYYYDAVLESHRTCESCNGSCDRTCNILIRKLDVVLRYVECIDELDHVELSVASDECYNIVLRLKVCIVSCEHESLDGLFYRQLQIVADVLDCLCARCEHLLYRLHLFYRRFIIYALCSFDCSSHSAVVAVEDVGLTPVGESRELVGLASADRAVVSLYDPVVKIHTCEDLLVCVILSHVSNVQVFFCSVECIGILHDELSCSQKSVSRTRLVSVLELDMIK